METCESAKSNATMVSFHHPGVVVGSDSIQDIPFHKQTVSSSASTPTMMMMTEDEGHDEVALTNVMSTQLEYFLVQRCWFSGPNVFPPSDCLRLFCSSTLAWQVAHASAHAYALAVAHRQGKSPEEVPVRTLLLPSLQASSASSSSPTAQQRQSAPQYGFTVAGALFWVRRVEVTATALATGSHACLTHGVIGGAHATLHPRRGTEVCAGRLFCGPGAAWKAAKVTEALQQEHNCNTSTIATNCHAQRQHQGPTTDNPFWVIWVPMVNSQDADAWAQQNLVDPSGQQRHLPNAGWLEDWPDRATWGLKASELSSHCCDIRGLNTGSMECEGDDKKRGYARSNATAGFVMHSYHEPVTTSSLSVSAKGSSLFNANMQNHNQNQWVRSVSLLEEDIPSGGVREPLSAAPANAHGNQVSPPFHIQQQHHVLVPPAKRFCFRSEEESTDANAAMTH